LNIITPELDDGQFCTHRPQPAQSFLDITGRLISSRDIATSGNGQAL
jgi:hypothetical protein